MKTRFLFFLVLLFTELSAANTVFGTWNLGTQRVRASRLTYNHEITIERDKITKTTHCHYGNIKMSASVTLPIEITVNVIKVLVGGQVDEGHGLLDLVCTAEMQAQEFTYTLVNVNRAYFQPFMGGVTAIRLPDRR